MRELFLRHGEIGRQLAAVDWSATPLGDPDDWPHSLRSVVGIMLSSRFAIWLGWGPELTFLCNDAYRRDTLGAKYPWALGRPAAEVWPEVWSEVTPLVEQVLEGGSVWEEDLQLFVERNGFREETYHTFSYSPLLDDDGAVGGLLCIVSETTEEVVGKRRMSVLRDLASALADKLTEEETLATTSRVLGEAARTLPFHLVYLDEPGGARLAASAGLPAGHPAAPERLATGEGPWPWPGEGDAPVLVEGIRDRFPLPDTVWGVPPERAAVVPIPGAQETPYGFLVLGLNPMRPYSQGYADFLGLVAGHVGAALTDARAYDYERDRAERLAELDRSNQIRVELERSRRLLDQAQRMARVGSWSYDLRDRRLEVSPEFLRILDRDDEWAKSAGYPGFLSRVAHPEDAEFVAAVLEEAAPGDQIGFEARILRPDGSTFHCSVRGVIEAGPEGGFVAQGSLQDITERRRAEEAIALAHATAEVAAREHQIAAELQASLLPASTYDLDHLDVATFYRPGQEGTEVGGDWYDVISLDGGRTALVMGDVMGHGVHAAAVMGQLRTAIRAYARLGMPPQRLMESVDDLVCDMFPDQIVTCVYAEFVPDEGAVSIVNAGHVPPLRVSGDGAVERIQGETHPPLGLGRPFPAPSVVRLDPGDRVLLYTDGLVERRGHDLEQGIAELGALLESRRVPLAELTGELVAEMLPGGAADDVALLLAQVPTGE